MVGDKSIGLKPQKSVVRLKIRVGAVFFAIKQQKAAADLENSANLGPLLLTKISKEFSLYKGLFLAKAEQLKRVE